MLKCQQFQHLGTRKIEFLGLSEHEKKLNFLIFNYKAFQISCSAELSMKFFTTLGPDICRSISCLSNVLNQLAAMLQ